MTDNLDEILEDPLFISANGFMDYLIYTYDNSYPLSGNDCSDDGEEIEIKFDYGYHNYDLGKKYLVQNFGTLSNYFEKYLTYKLEQLDINKDNYFIVKYDDDNVFLFSVPFVQLAKNTDDNIKDMNSFKIKNISVYIFGKLDFIKNATELEKYIDYNDIIEKLELQASANKYNL